MVHSVAITLLRHGLTEANERREYLGWTDSPVSKRGRVEIEKVNGCFPEYEALFSSDLTRCLDTAKWLFPTLSVQIISAFREMNWGHWEGKTYEQLKGDLSYQQWIADPMKAGIPAGESFPIFSERVALGWKRLLVEEAGSMAVMTHGGVIRELLVHFAPEEKLFWEWEIPHAGGYELVWENREAWRRGERCTSLRVVPIMEKQNG